MTDNGIPATGITQERARRRAVGHRHRHRQDRKGRVVSDLHTNGTANRAPSGAQNDIVTQVLALWHDDRIRTHSVSCWQWHPECAVALLGDEVEHRQAEIERLRGRSCSTCVHGRKRPAEADEPDCYACAGVLKGNSFAMPFYCSAYEEARRG